MIEYDISAIIAPIPKTSLFNVVLPNSESNWLSINIVPTNSPSYIRIYVNVSIAGTIRIARTVDNNTITENLNSGSNLIANASYMFTSEWRNGDTINIRYSTTSGTIKILRIDEIGGAE